MDTHTKGGTYFTENQRYEYVLQHNFLIQNFNELLD